tara:strand:- start:6894 stop:8672 length:1779 start_codon:yes stop_codon:yes gene_type:complete
MAYATNNPYEHLARMRKDEELNKGVSSIGLPTEDFFSGQLGNQLNTDVLGNNSIMDTLSTFPGVSSEPQFATDNVTNLVNDPTNPVSAEDIQKADIINQASGAPSATDLINGVSVETSEDAISQGPYMGSHIGNQNINQGGPFSTFNPNLESGYHDNTMYGPGSNIDTGPALTDAFNRVSGLGIGEGTQPSPFSIGSEGQSLNDLKAGDTLAGVGGQGSGGMSMGDKVSFNPDSTSFEVNPITSPLKSGNYSVLDESSFPPEDLGTFTPPPTQRSNLELPDGMNRNKLYMDDGKTMQKKFLGPDVDVSQKLSDWNQGTDLANNQMLQDGQVVPDQGYIDMFETPSDQQEIELAQFNTLSPEHQAQVIAQRKQNITNQNTFPNTLGNEAWSLDQLPNAETPFRPHVPVESEDDLFDEDINLSQVELDKLEPRGKLDQWLYPPSFKDQGLVSKIARAGIETPGKVKDFFKEGGVKNTWNKLKEMQKTPEGQKRMGEWAKLFANFYEDSTGREKGSSWQSKAADMAIESAADDSARNVGQDQTQQQLTNAARINDLAYGVTDPQVFLEMLNKGEISHADYQALLKVWNMQQGGTQ